MTFAISSLLLRDANVLPRLACLSLVATAIWGIDYTEQHPFGTATSYAKVADATAIGSWWKPEPGEKFQEMRQWFRTRPRDQTLAFAVYTHHKGTLKLSAQCFPLMPDEPKSVVLEFQRDGTWARTDEQPVQYPGWSAHFRVAQWEASKEVSYRVRLGALSQFTGTIRRDPAEKKSITVASMSCNSPKDPVRYARTELVQNLLKHDPDLLFFAGDQSYHHENHTYGWLQTGVQFAELIKDRPVVSIPDDHDVGHGNLWGENGKVSTDQGGADGGYLFPAGYVQMVERCQTWHLPDPFDATPVLQDIKVYYTELVLGGVSFAILEDRKFKTGPLGRIPKMGPRPDHINDPAYDRTTIDLPGLEMLGGRQLAFLDAWARDWSGAVMKCALSQTAFCGAVHLHGTANNRLLADLDSNAWPQTARNQALKALRRAWATHLCGDQHLAVMVRHGIDSFRDGPWSFTNPALVNTYYGRWWWPADGKAGGGAAIPSPLPWTGDYEDGLGNRITMVAYANPDGRRLEDTAKENRGDGYGLVRFNKEAGTVICECWPRFADLAQGDKAQFPGWPVTFPASDNDGRKPIGHLPEVTLPVADGVVAVTRQDDGELMYCHRIRGRTFRAPVYAPGRYTVTAGPDRPEQVLLKDAAPSP